MSRSLKVEHEDFNEEPFCRKHGETSVLKTGTFAGYDGAVCYFWKYQCGCTVTSDIDDIWTAE